MWSELEAVFNELKLPYSRQGSYESDAEFPESFFTFWNFNTPESGWYDNESHKTIWVWYVYFYTKDPSKLYTEMDLLVDELKKRGFIIETRGQDIKCERPDYIGRYIRTTYIQNRFEKEIQNGKEVL